MVLPIMKACQRLGWNNNPNQAILKNDIIV